MLSLKEGFRIVHSEYVLVDKSIYLWVEQTLDVDVPDKKLQFKVVKSGEPLPDRLQYVSSVVDNFAPEAYHIFTEPSVSVATKSIDLSKLIYTAA
jgi:hypothetical protein